MRTTPVNNLETTPERTARASALRIIEAKVQTVYLAQNDPATPDRADADSNIESDRRFKVRLGTYAEFSDGCTIAGPDGRTHAGRGTVVRFNYRHGTWSVQRPQRCETDRLGYVFTELGRPSWLKDEREAGFKLREFERAFSPAFVKLCLDGHALAEARATRTPGRMSA